MAISSQELLDKIQRFVDSKAGALAGVPPGSIEELKDDLLHQAVVGLSKIARNVQFVQRQANVERERVEGVLGEAQNRIAALANIFSVLFMDKASQLHFPTEDVALYAIRLIRDPDYEVQDREELANSSEDIEICISSSELYHQAIAWARGKLAELGKAGPKR